MRFSSLRVLHEAAVWRTPGARHFSSSLPRKEIRDIESLPPRVYPQYKGVNKFIYCQVTKC